MPAPSDVPPKPFVHPTLGRCSSRWDYASPGGQLLFQVYRFGLPGGGKEMRPLSLWRDPSGGLRWHWKAFPAPGSLYGLDQLAAGPDATVVIVEGEKSVDAAARIYLKSVCVTSRGGSQAALKADWSPLAGYRILLWPDADAPGAKYAVEVAAILHGRGCDVSIIDAAALASIDTNGGSRDPIECWDAADAVAEWQDITALCKAASELSKPYVVNDVIRTVADVDIAKREDVPPKQKPEAGPDRARSARQRRPMWPTKAP
jgi:putative DNA primase/helicase